MQPNEVNMNEMDYGRWNEWDGLWTKGNKNETWSMQCGLTERSEMKHEEWSVDLRKCGETWSIKCELKVTRRSMNNEVDNVTLSSQILLFFKYVIKLLDSQSRGPVF